jgi:hypothetical protein
VQCPSLSANMCVACLAVWFKKSSLQTVSRGQGNNLSSCGYAGRSLNNLLTSKSWTRLRCQSLVETVYNRIAAPLLMRADSLGLPSSSCALRSGVDFGSSIEPLTLPAAWLRGALNATYYVEWYATRYSLILRGVGDWKALSGHPMNRVEADTFRPLLRLFAHRQDSIPRWLRQG